MTNYAVEDFSNAMLAGGGLQDCLHAFKVWGVYGLWTLLAAYVMLVLAAVVLARNAFGMSPYPSWPCRWRYWRSRWSPGSGP